MSLFQVSRLTGRCEQLEQDQKNCEDRYQSTLTELEKQTIVSKDREKKIHMLMEEVRTFNIQKLFENNLTTGRAWN